VCEGDVNTETMHHCSLLLLGYKLNAVAIIVNDLLKVGTKRVAPKVSEHSNVMKV
jgi:hypothetical protein